MKLARKDEMEKPALRFVLFSLLLLKWVIIQFTKLKHRQISLFLSLFKPPRVISSYSQLFKYHFY